MSSTMLVLAAAAPAGGPPGWVQILPLLAMGVIFWFLVFRPQMKRHKAHQAKIASLQKGDKVVTAGGLVGKIVKLDEHYVDIDLGQNVKVKAVRSTIGDVIPPGGSAPAND
ncbi:preprotein translocase subunit YajC [Croceicoccus sediminis]|uniref:preprotein translocase subunit YajC n=1 Tax=Croceicoccus sediminis TaxID=2571150 RepID=UPI001F0F295D|nr:preprotein translocase subunit YajC [Croceicoccus sediminis]